MSRTWICTHCSVRRLSTATKPPSPLREARRRARAKYDPTVTVDGRPKTLAPRDDADSFTQRANSWAREWSDGNTRQPLRRPMNPATAVYSPSDWDRDGEPSLAQRRHAGRFFTSQPSALRWATMHFRTVPRSDSPEVCFIGRSNVGKSSLINAVLATPALAHVSANPGRTKAMLAFGTGTNKRRPGDEDEKGELVLLDTPGYGKGSYTEWGKEIIKYLEKRQQLRRAFLLIDGRVGLKDSDRHLLSLLRPLDLPHQIVMTKVDQLLPPKTESASSAEMRDLLQTIKLKKQLTPYLGGSLVPEVLPCSAASATKTGLGIEHLRFRMLEAVGLARAAKESPEEVAGDSEENPYVGDDIPEENKADTKAMLRTRRAVLAKHPDIVPFEEVFKMMN